MPSCAANCRYWSGVWGSVFGTLLNHQSLSCPVDLDMLVRSLEAALKDLAGRVGGVSE